MFACAACIVCAIPVPGGFTFALFGLVGFV